MDKNEVKNIKLKNRQYAKKIWNEILNDSKIKTQILSNFEKFLKNHTKDRIFAFYPLKSELQILKILEKLYKNIYIPVVERDHMYYALYKKYQEYLPLRKNQYGILEPDINQIELENKILYPNYNDIVIIPSLGANQFFARLGRGGGYYDKFFFHHKESLKSIKVSLLPETLFELNFIHENHDLILDIVITENNIVYK